MVYSIIGSLLKIGISLYVDFDLLVDIMYI